MRRRYYQNSITHGGYKREFVVSLDGMYTILYRYLGVPVSGGIDHITLE